MYERPCMNVKVEGGWTFWNVYVPPYIHCLPSGVGGGGGGGYTENQISIQVTGMIEWDLCLT